jgi:cell division protein FtsW
VIAATAVLAAMGLVMVYSTTAPLALGAWVPPHFQRQLVGVGLGIALAFGAMRLPLSFWYRAAWPLWGLAVALLAVTLAVGTRVNGAQRWLTLPGVGTVLQPGEVAKFATLVACSAALSTRDGVARRAGWMRGSGVVMALAAVPAGLLFLEPDTKGAALLLLLVALQLFAAGTPLRLFAIPAAAIGAALGVAVAIRPYVAHRILAFLDPWQRASGEGFQLVQSFVAFARGGLLGVGLGDGRQKLYYLPEAHTDFVLSVIAEELGLVGVSLVLGAFAALVVCGFRIAGRARSRFAFLLAFSMTSFVAVPAVLNAAVVTGLVPPTGLTLPFVSYGRTSLLVSFVAIGVLLGVGRREAGAPPGGARTWTP